MIDFLTVCYHLLTLHYFRSSALDPLMRVRMIRFHLSLAALSLYVLPAYGTATKYVIFNDTNCTQEIYTGLIYRPIVETKNDGTQVLVE